MTESDFNVSTPRIFICFVDEEIDEASAWRWLGDEESGARVVFLGCTRRTTGSLLTEYLFYSAYRAMAEQELHRLAHAACEQYQLRSAMIQHRLGRVDVGQPSILVGVGCAHRAKAFEAVAWMMDQIKISVPIWKQEHRPDGVVEWIHQGK